MMLHGEEPTQDQPTAWFVPCSAIDDARPMLDEAERLFREDKRREGADVLFS